MSNWRYASIHLSINADVPPKHCDGSRVRFEDNLDLANSANLLMAEEWRPGAKEKKYFFV